LKTFAIAMFWNLITLSKWFVGGELNEFDPQSSHVGNKTLD